MANLIFESILPPSLQPKSRLQKVAAILSSALLAVDPAVAVMQVLSKEENLLKVKEEIYDLSRINRIWLIGVGKAGVPMAQSAAAILGDRLSGGIVIVKEGFTSGSLPNNVTLLEAGHPIPDHRSQNGAQQIEHLLRKLTPDDLVLCMISGGGSALLSNPVRGVSLADLQILSQLLLDCGASVSEINTLRKHLDKFKGGQLVKHASPAQVVSLILSDVVGNPLDIIASGLTVPDPSSYLDAVIILEKYNLMNRIPTPIINHLQKGIRGEISETPKPENAIFNRVQNEIIASNLNACQAAYRKAQELGFNTHILTTYLQGEAREAGRFLVTILRQIADTGQPLSRPACMVVGGETTVTIKGKGKGGRNLELALSAAIEMDGLSDVALITLASDGNDGPTDAAGAYVDGLTLSRAQQHKLNPSQYLEENNSYPFFDTLGDLIKTGPTQTNVNDLTFLFAF